MLIIFNTVHNWKFFKWFFHMYGLEVCVFFCEPEAARPVFLPISTPLSEFFPILLEQLDQLLVFSFPRFWLPTCSTLSRKWQNSHFFLCDPTVLLRWSLQYGRRWLQFPNNRCSIQSYFSNQCNLLIEILVYMHHCQGYLQYLKK